jgi:DNA-binding NarL/FixJ family response regulator
VVRIMIVDDSAAICAVWKDMLSRISGVKLCGIYGSTLPALKAISEHKPDVILLDIELGTESGSQVLRFAISNFPEIKVIVVSNYADKIYRKHYINAGAYAFFDKSHELHKLRGILLSLAEAGNAKSRTNGAAGSAAHSHLV